MKRAIKSILCALSVTAVSAFALIGSGCSGGDIEQTITETLCFHEWNGGAVTKVATCTESGEKLLTCTECGKTKTQTVAATGHSVITADGYTATCTTVGQSSGSYCENCGVVFGGLETLPALGHTDENSDNYCEVCGEYTKNNNIEYM